MDVAVVCFFFFYKKTNDSQIVVLSDSPSQCRWHLAKAVSSRCHMQHADSSTKDSSPVVNVFIIAGRALWILGRSEFPEPCKFVNILSIGSFHSSLSLMSIFPSSGRVCFNSDKSLIPKWVGNYNDSSWPLTSTWSKLCIASHCTRKETGLTMQREFL